MVDPDPGQRQRSGRHAEDAAEALLLSRGHRLVARNLRLGHLEVDMVSVDPADGSLVLTEVKARRGGRHAPELRVDRTKRRRLIRAATLLLARPAFRNRAARFDVVAVQLDDGGRPTDTRHLPRAFTADDG
jgi:putative endonuclease